MPARHHRRLASIVAIVLTGLLLGPASSRADAGPPNDHLSEATAVGPLPASLTGDTSGATMEPGEPDICDPIGATVWFRLVAQEDASLTVDTFGSDFDTMLGIFDAFQGDSYEGLEWWDCNDDADGTLQSEVTIPVFEGETYFVQLGGFEGETGPYTIRFATGALDPPPEGPPGGDPGTGGTSISGTVGAEDGSAGFFCVAAVPEDPTEGGMYVGDFVFGSPAEYVLEVEPAAYVVEFSDCGRAEYMAEWWDDRPDSDSADIIVVEEGEQVSSIDALLSRGGSISGRVTNDAGQPMPACVEVYDLDGFEVAFVEAFDDGTYEVGGLRPGPHKVLFMDCEDGFYLDEWYDDQPTFERADPVTVLDEGRVTGIDAVLSEAGVISGMVTDQDGQPLDRACIEVFDLQGAVVGDDFTGFGEYRVEGLRPGDYRVRFRSCGEGSHVQEWYDDRPDQASADLVRVVGGVETAGIDASLEALGSLRGQVRNSSGQLLSGICVDLHQGGGPIASETTGPSGGYVFSDLSAGTYTLHVEQCGGSAYADEWFDDRRAPELADPLEIAAGEQKVVDVTLERWGRVSGSVTDHRDRVLHGVCVEARAADGSVAGHGTTSTQGTYEIGELPGGPYHVKFRMCEGSSHLPEWYDDRPDLASADPIAVAFDEVTTGIDAALQGPDLVILQTDGGTLVEEGAEGDTYSVALAAPPAEDVVVQIAPDDQVAVEPASLTFTAGDWALPKAVEVTAVDDLQDEAEMHPAAIRHDASGAPGYEGLSASLAVQVRDRRPIPATLRYEGETSGIRGRSVTLTAALENEGELPVEGRTLRFSLGGSDATATTDAAGVASVDVPVDEPYGSHELVVRFAGDHLLLPQETSATFEALWEHQFTDGDRTLRVNTITKELQFEAPGDVSEVKTDPEMEIQTLPTGDRVITLEYADEDLTVVGRFLPDRGIFAAVVNTPSDPYLLTGGP